MLTGKSRPNSTPLRTPSSPQPTTVTSTTWPTGRGAQFHTRRIWRTRASSLIDYLSGLRNARTSTGSREKYRAIWSTERPNSESALSDGRSIGQRTPCANACFSRPSNSSRLRSMTKSFLPNAQSVKCCCPDVVPFRNLSHSRNYSILQEVIRATCLFCTNILSYDRCSSGIGEPASRRRRSRPAPGSMSSSRVSPSGKGFGLSICYLIIEAKADPRRLPCDARASWRFRQPLLGSRGIYRDPARVVPAD